MACLTTVRPRRCSSDASSSAGHAELVGGWVWSDTGKAWAEGGSNTGQTRVRHWSDTGQTLVIYGPNDGHIRAKHWSNMGQTLVKYGFNTGRAKHGPSAGRQTLVKHGSDTGQMWVRCWSAGGRMASRAEPGRLVGRGGLGWRTDSVKRVDRRRGQIKGWGGGRIRSKGGQA